MNLATSIGLMQILFLILFVVFMPLLVLWALHTVFGVAVTYDFAHWFAVLILCFAIKGIGISRNKG